MTKRFFQIVRDDEEIVVGVASDAEHFKAVIDDAYDAEHNIASVKEISAEDALGIECDATEINMGKRPLSSFEPGDWFSSEDE